jgi:ABC-type transport system involved in resistance to organic solvents, permease component
VNPLAAIGASTLSIFRLIGAAAIFATRALAAAGSPPFYVDQIGRQMLRIGFFSLPVVGLTAVFIGAALALNIYTGGARFNAEQFVPNIVVLGITRELGPVLAALMLAGRVSAAIAAEIGTMRVTEQIDALKTLSTDPMRFLVAPRVLAAVVTLPLLVIVADILGVMGGFLVSVWSLDFNPSVYLRNTIEFLEAADVGTGLIKAAVFGFLLAVMGCFHGDRSAGGARGVGIAATHAVVSAAVLIFAANYVMTALFVER